MAIKKYTTGKCIQPDCESGAITSIDYDHYTVHQKAMFSITHYNESVADEGYCGIGFTVPTGYEMHVKSLQVMGFGFPFLFELFPFASYTPGASNKTPNSHFVSPSTVASILGEINLDPTSPSSPVDTMSFIFGGGTGFASNHSTGIYSPSGEYILDAGTYVARITNNVGEETTCQLRANWYEVEET